MANILSSPALLNCCVGPFDVGRLWKGESAPLLREQLQMHFQNITTIMDCVGCEKCKLWGKVQFLGVATALKILFVSNGYFERQLPPWELLKQLELERNEVIALVNLLSKLSQSVATYRAMSERLLAEERIEPCFMPRDAVT
jgi:ERO1-like protein alpha